MTIIRWIIVAFDENCKEDANYHFIEYVSSRWRARTWQSLLNLIFLFLTIFQLQSFTSFFLRKYSYVIFYFYFFYFPLLCFALWVSKFWSRNLFDLKWFSFIITASAFNDNFHIFVRHFYSFLRFKYDDTMKYWHSSEIVKNEKIFFGTRHIRNIFKMFEFSEIIKFFKISREVPSVGPSSLH